jgi:hypothetical protein
MDTTVNQLSRALGVFLLDPRIRSFLDSTDPKSVEQAETALRAAHGANWRQALTLEESPGDMALRLAAEHRIPGRITPIRVYNLARRAWEEVPRNTLVCLSEDCDAGIDDASPGELSVFEVGDTVHHICADTWQRRAPLERAYVEDLDGLWWPCSLTEPS